MLESWIYQLTFSASINKCVTEELTKKHKMTQMSLSLQRLFRYANKGEACSTGLLRTHYYQPKTWFDVIEIFFFTVNKEIQGCDMIMLTSIVI